MASGTHKPHQQLGTGCNGSSTKAAHHHHHHPHQCSSREEGEQDMHLKMCKKIAQLTKVIYALNTKNDEHEASIQALEEAHQEKVQHILAETREAVLRYRNKVEEEHVLRKHIQTLEDTLEKYRRLKGEVSSEFAACKKQVEESDLRSEMEHTDEKMVLPKESSHHVKPDCENRVQTSNQEADGLIKERWAFEGKELDHKEKLSDAYSAEMQDAISETANLQQENQKLARYAEQANQLQAFHEREKETWKKVTQQAVAETCREWQQREAEQRRNYEAREAASQQQVKKLEADLEAKGQRIGELRKHSQKLKEKMQDLEIQLKEAQQVNVACKNLVKTLEEELVIAKERLLLQENEILHKTEAMEMALNSKTNARNEMDEMKKIPVLQQALSTKQSQGDQNGGDLKPGETVGLEKNTIQQRHQEEIRKIKHESEEEKMRLKEQLVKGLEDLVKKHTLEIKSVQASVDVEKQKLQKEVQTQLEELKKKYEKQIIQLQKEKEAVNGKLQDCSLEILRLEDFIRQNRDIPKLAEFLKSHTRKTRGRQQEDVLVQQKDIPKQPKERAKCREQPPGTRNEERSRLDSGGAQKREDRQTLASFQKEKSKEIQALQEEWYYQKTELQAQVTQLKETLEQQANVFREALQEQSREFGKEKEKLLQDLQDTIKESQDMKAQLEASHQRAINLLEKSKNQELKEVEEHWKKECDGRFKEQQESHSLEMQTLEEKAREELQSELERMQKQQALLIESLRMELSEQRVSCVTHKKEKEELQVELKNTMTTKRQQEGSYQNQIKSLQDELEKYQNDILGLKKENALLKDTVDLLSVDVEQQKQTSTQLQDRENQHRRPKELDEKPRKREEDYLIGCLQDKLNEKEELIKELMDGRKLQHSLMSSSEPRRNRSFSFNTNPSCLTPIAKKKKMEEAPSRIVSVPNLASYARSFLSGDLRPKRNPSQITKSTSLDQNPGCVRVCYPSVPGMESKPVPRLQSNETSTPKDGQKQDPQHQEWFTKYFSF